MTAISSDFDTDDVRFDSMKSNDTINLRDREDQVAIEKTKEILTRSLNTSSTNASLEGRVTMGPVGTNEIRNNETSNTLFEQLQEIEPEHFQAVEQSITDGLDLDKNFIREIQILVAQILAQLNRIAANDRTQIEQLKTKYRNTTLESANLQRELGWHGLKFAGIALGVSFLKFALPQNAQKERNSDDLAMIDLFATQICPKTGGLFESSINANKSQADSLAGLLLQEYQAKTNKGSADNANKGEITEMLNKALRLLEAASKTN